MKVKVFGRDELIRANQIAIERGYNRTLDPDLLSALPADFTFPVVLSIPHEHAAGKPVNMHVRCVLAVASSGGFPMIDVDADLFDALGELEVPQP